MKGRDVIALADAATGVPIGGPSEWSAAGGLPGLVIFALFVLMALGFGVSVKFLKGILDDHKTERSEWSSKSDAERDSHVKAIQEIAAATTKAFEQHKETTSTIQREIRELTVAIERGVDRGK